MSNPAFKWKHFAAEVILWSVRWYGSTPMSYANLSDMLSERGISVHRTTLYRWFIEYSPALRKKLRRYQFIRKDSSWQLDETYVKVKGQWGDYQSTYHSSPLDCFIDKAELDAAESNEAINT